MGNEKVRDPPANCRIYVVEYAVSSVLRHRILDGFQGRGATLVTKAIDRKPASPFLLFFDVESGAWKVDEPSFF